MKLKVLFLFTLLFVSACGFHLRGSQATKIDIDNIYVSNSGAPRLAQQVITQLELAETRIAKSSDLASYIVKFSNEAFTRKVLSVNPETGKIEEYDLILTAKMDVNDANGKTLANNEALQIIRDFTFDENAALGKFTEEVVIQEDMMRRAASQALRRLQAVVSRSDN